MADFKKIINFIIKEIEGKYSINRKDKGNYKNWTISESNWLGTNWGISGAFIYSFDKTITEAKMRAMTKEKAISIYQKYFWNGLGFGELKSNAIAFQFFDHYLNRGNITKDLKIFLKEKYPWIKSSSNRLTTDEVAMINNIGDVKFYKYLQLCRYKDYQKYYPSAHNMKRPYMWMNLDYNYPNTAEAEKKKTKRIRFPVNPAPRSWIDDLFSKPLYRKVEG